MRLYHWVAAMSEECPDIPVALCLELDLVTQGESGENPADMRPHCELMLAGTYLSDLEHGYDMNTRPPPPDSEIAEFRARKGAVEFTIEFDSKPACSTREHPLAALHRNKGE